MYQSVFVITEERNECIIATEVSKHLISSMACRSAQNRTYSGGGGKERNKEMNSPDFIKPEILHLDKSVGDESTECQPIRIQDIIGRIISSYIVSKQKKSN